MLARPIGRASCPQCSHPFNATFTARTSAPTGVAARRSVQRRLSSSKASCPPGGGSSRPGSESATGNTQKASSPDERDRAAGSDPSPTRVSNAGRKRSKYATAGASTLGVDEGAKVETFANVPAVPPTNHLHENDVKLSSFFALHRPMSIHSPMPQSSSSSTFQSIFAPPAPAKWRPADVIYTLNTAVSSLDPSTAQQQTLQDSVISQSPSHNGTAPQMKELDLEDLLKKYKPFHKPPAPIPLDAEFASTTRPKSRKKQQKELLSPQQVDREEKKTYTTTLTISESTNRSSGARTYTASAGTVVEMADPSASTHAQGSTLTGRQPFLTRMHARNLTQLQKLENRVSSIRQAVELQGAEKAEAVENPGNQNDPIPSDFDGNRELAVGEETNSDKQMLLISVRRRRKLKMKKHKYKKLLRRTRNIRRREGRT